MGCNPTSPPTQADARTRYICVPRWKRNVAQRGDALTLLQSLPNSCTPLVFLDPQHRGVLDKLKFGNEGARQKGRHALPAMTNAYIDACCREIARVLRPSGYLMLWADTFNLCQGHHLRVIDVLPPVDLIAWDSLRMGMGKRTRRRGDFLLVLQKPPIVAKTWRDHSIPSRWPEKVERKLHPHVKPAGLIARLIGAVTLPGDLVIDPAAGGFGVLHATLHLGREFVGCDITYRPPPQVGTCPDQGFPGDSRRARADSRYPRRAAEVPLKSQGNSDVSATAVADASQDVADPAATSDTIGGSP